MAKNIHTVTHPDGTKSRRTSLNRTYTHAIQETARLEDGRLIFGIYTWCGSEALAQKAHRTETKQMMGRTIQRFDGENGYRPATVIGVTIVPVEQGVR